MNENEYNYKEIFDSYFEDETLETFHILHLYDTGEKCKIDNSGFEDARHMQVVGYNKTLKKKKNLGRHDQIDFYNTNKKPSYIRIFADGSTIIYFHEDIRIGNYQSMEIL